MPFIGRNRLTGHIAAGFMTNVYQFTYYGARWWDNEEEAEAAMAENLAEPGAEGAGRWECVEVTEQKLKVLNVKLNNDPRRSVRMEENGAITVETAADEAGVEPLRGGNTSSGSEV